MDNRSRKRSACILLLFGICICAALIAHYYLQPNTTPQERYRDQSHDRKLINDTNAKLDAGLDSNYRILNPELAKFGLHLGAPAKSECNEGDPSLYKYACGGNALVDGDQELQVIGTSANAAATLTNFDAFMRKNGFNIGSNDFRKMRAFKYSLDRYDLTKGGADIEYDKGSCYIQFRILLATPGYNKANGLSGIWCAEDLLPGFYY